MVRSFQAGRTPSRGKLHLGALSREFDQAHLGDESGRQTAQPGREYSYKAAAGTRGWRSAGSLLELGDEATRLSTVRKGIDDHVEWCSRSKYVKGSSHPCMCSVTQPRRKLVNSRPPDMTSG